MSGSKELFNIKKNLENNTKKIGISGMIFLLKKLIEDEIISDDIDIDKISTEVGDLWWNDGDEKKKTTKKEKCTISSSSRNKILSSKSIESNINEVKGCKFPTSKFKGEIDNQFYPYEDYLKLKKHIDGVLCNNIVMVGDKKTVCCSYPIKNNNFCNACENPATPPPIVTNSMKPKGRPRGSKNVYCVINEKIMTKTDRESVYVITKGVCEGYVVKIVNGHLSLIGKTDLDLSDDEEIDENSHISLGDGWNVKPKTISKKCKKELDEYNVHYSGTEI